MYEQSIYQLDLCLLSYQLHTQTLLWPMDPYSEQMARKWTRRRDAFLGRARKRFAERRVPNHLDPILTDLRRLGPVRPCFVKPERDGGWAVFDAPDQIAGRIGTMFLATSHGAEVALLSREHSGSAERPDELYCFEGLTGGVKRRQGHGSFLGFVLVHEVPESADYDVHVVFRGSRSGWVVRSAVRGLVAGQGNPDWTTAMDLWQQVEDPAISATGRSSRGFARSMAASLPNIVKCLDAIDRPGPPRTIHVSGHSLGGALATHFAAAMVLAAPEGSARARSAGAVGWRSWPWDNVRLSTYGAPTVGDRAFRSALESSVTADRYLIAGDPVASARFEKWGVHVGTERVLQPPGEPIRTRFRWGRKARERRARVRQENHDPVLIRRALVERGREEGLDLAGVPGASGVDDPGEPWKRYATFAEVLAGHPFHGESAALATALDGLGAPLIAYLELAEWVLRKRKAYAFYLKSARERRLASGAVRQVIEALRDIEEDPGDPAASERVWLRIRDALNDEAMHAYLGLCLVLAHLAKVPETRLDDFGELAACVERT